MQFNYTQLFNEKQGFLFNNVFLVILNPGFFVILNLGFFVILNPEGVKDPVIFYFYILPYENDRSCRGRH